MSEWFGNVRWCDDDIRDALHSMGLPQTERNVSEVRRLCETHHFTDRVIEAGWESMFGLIEDLNNYGALDQDVADDNYNDGNSNEEE